MRVFDDAKATTPCREPGGDLEATGTTTAIRKSTIGEKAISTTDQGSAAWVIAD